jgi:hypothetical protein
LKSLRERERDGAEQLRKQAKAIYKISGVSWRRSKAVKNRNQIAMDVIKTQQIASRPIEKVIVHPLVLLSIVDNYNRVARDTNKRVVGVLLGSTFKGTVDVTNSYAGTSLYYLLLIRFLVSFGSEISLIFFTALALHLIP